jgi:hypothetical protein
MFSELDTEQMAREQNIGSGARPPKEVEQIVVMVRLELYNRSLPCGPKSLRRRLAEHYALKPLGLVLVLKTDSVLNWIDRKKQTTEQESGHVRK